MIGKLQTEQDKARLLDGLEGASPGVDRGAFDRMISLLDKRVFLLHNVHEDEPQVFHTRWAMNYLPGPLTRTQIPELNALVSAKSHKVAGSKETPAEREEKALQSSLGQDVPPSISGSVSVHFLPVGKGPSEALKDAGQSLKGETPQPRYLYRPVLAGQARVAFLDRKHNISNEAAFTIRVKEMRRKGLVRWEDYTTEPIDLDALADTPRPEAAFDTLDDLAIDDSKYVNSLKADFEDWIYRTQTMTIRVNEVLGIAAGPEVSEDAFREMCDEAAEEKKEAEIDALEDKYQSKLKKLEEKLQKETMEWEEDKQELNHRRMEEGGKAIENLLSLVSGRRRSMTTSLTKRRMTAKAKTDVEESEQDIQNVEEEIEAMKAELVEELEEVKEHWEEAQDQVMEVPVSPYKKNIFMEMFGLLWVPYYAFEVDRGWLTVPAFDWEDE